MKRIFKKGISLILIMTMVVPMYCNIGLSASEESDNIADEILSQAQGSADVIVEDDIVEENNPTSGKESDTVTGEFASASSGTCGDNLTWTLDDNGILTISGTGYMYNYTYSNHSPFYNNISIKSIIILDNVTDIGDYAFYNCTNLTSVTIRSSVTSIGDRAFFYCSSLTSITIPDSVTSIGDYAFYNCTNFTSVTIPDSVTSIGWGAFSYCSSLTSITIPDSVTSIGDYAFQYCSSLTSVTIPNSVTSIGYSAFYKCTGLTSVTIPDSVTSIGDYAFKNCSNLIIKCYEGSYADTYAQKHSIPVEYICDHIFTNYISDNNSTCTEDGTKTAYCDNGCGMTDTVVVEGTALGHSFTNYISDKNGTCFEDGTKTAYCDNGCGMTDTLVEENSKIHNYILDVIREPSCTRAGMGMYMCSICKDYYTESIEIIPHVYTQYSYNNDATCTEDGTETSYCDYSCGATNTRVAEDTALGHSYTSYLFNNDSTCTEDGTKTAYCDNGCGTTDTITAEDTALGHSYTSYLFNSDSTCTEDGTKTAYCDNSCGTTDTITAEGTALGHSYTNYVFNNDSNCTKDGTKTASCDNGCGETETVTAVGTALGHSFTNYIFNNDSSCTYLGTLTAICDNGCGTTDTTDVIGEPAGHDYIEEIIEEPTCTTDGIALYVCLVCRDYYTDILPELGHSGEWIVITEPTSTSEGEKTFTCTVCGYTETEVIPAFGIPVISTDNYNVSLTGAEYITYIRYALGDYNSASEIKNAEGCITLNASKIASYTKDGVCTIAMPDGGIYSLWVKLNDGTEYIYKADLTVMDQEIEADGVTMTVKNLYGVKDYFIAKGEYDNYTDLRANALVQITKKKIGTSHDYTYILSEPGTYTVCVRYDDSTRAHKFMTVELTVVEPAFTENGLQLKVSNLEGIKVIRTAYGDYSTPGQIKKAVGARAFTGKTVLKGLDEYSIQYRDEGLITVAVVYNNGYEVIYKYNVTKKSPGFTQEGNTVTFTNLEDFKVIRYAVGVYTTSNQIKNAKGSVTISAKNMTEASYSVTLTPGTYTFCVQYNDESYNYYTVTVE